MSCSVCSANVTEILVALPQTLERDSATFCKACLVGQEVAAFIPMVHDWKVGIVQEYHQASDHILLSFDQGRLGWGKVNPEPFVSYTRAMRTSLAKPRGIHWRQVSDSGRQTLLPGHESMDETVDTIPAKDSSHGAMKASVLDEREDTEDATTMEGVESNCRMEPDASMPVDPRGEPKLPENSTGEECVA